MGLPKSVVKIRKNGVEYIDSVDRVKYTMKELQRRALSDVAKLIRKRLIAKLKQSPYMKRLRRVYTSTQYWVRKREADLQIGFKHDSWYGARGELGTHNQPKRGYLRQTVFENISEIRRITGKYISAIEDENKAIGLIDVNGEPIYSPDGEE